VTQVGQGTEIGHGSALVATKAADDGGSGGGGDENGDDDDGDDDACATHSQRVPDQGCRGPH